MLYLYFLIFNFSVITVYAAECPQWQQPLPGSQDEVTLINRAANYHIHHRHCEPFWADDFLQFETFVADNLDAIRTKLYDAIEDRRAELKNMKSPYAGHMPAFIKKATAGPWYQINELDDSSYAVYQTKNDERKEPKRDQALFFRARMYAEIFNELAGRKSNYLSQLKQARTLDNMSATHLELLAQVCLQIQTETIDRAERYTKYEILKPKIKNTEGFCPEDATSHAENTTTSIPQSQLASFLSSIGKEIQTDLSNPALNTYSEPVNQAGIYTAHEGSCERANGPFVQWVSNPNPVISDRDVAKRFPNAEEIKPARMIKNGSWIWNYTKNKRDHNVRDTNCFWCSDGIVGCDLTIELPQFTTGYAHEIVAQSWVTTETENSCVFAYKMRFWGPKGETKYAIAKVNLPTFSQKKYITLRNQNTGGKNTIETQKVLLLQQKHVQITENDLLYVDKPVTALAYDSASKTIIYALDDKLKYARTALQSKNSCTIQVMACGYSQHTFEGTIKKIMVLSEDDYLVYTENGIYRYWKGVKEPIQINLQSSLANSIIDIGYDRSTQKIALLTKDGVYMPDSEVFFRLSLHKNKSELLCDLIKNKDFDYTKHSYKQLDFRNGQIYCIGDKKVLIYQPQRASE